MCVKDSTNWTQYPTTFDATGSCDATAAFDMFNFMESDSCSTPPGAPAAITSMTDCELPDINECKRSVTTELNGLLKFIEPANWLKTNLACMAEKNKLQTNVNGRASN